MLRLRGSFSLEHHDISVSIGRRKRENIVRSGCRVVATGCRPACCTYPTCFPGPGIEFRSDTPRDLRRKHWGGNEFDRTAGSVSGPYSLMGRFRRTFHSTTVI